MALRPWGMQSCRALLSCTLVCLLISPSVAADDPARALMQQAWQARDAGQLDQSIALCNQLIAQYPQSRYAPSAYYAIMATEKARENWDAVLAAAERILAEVDDPVTRGCAVDTKLVELLHRQKKPEEAAQFGQEQLAELGAECTHGTRNMVLYNTALALERSGHPDQAIALYDEFLPTCPAYLGSARHEDHLVRLLIEAGETEEALAAARVAYALCNFEQETIEAMSDLVRRAFVARGEIFNATQFFAAQEDPEQTNPLASVPMPEVTAEQLDVMLASAGDDTAVEIGVYLYAGDYHNAMMTATEAMSQAKLEDMAAALSQVARVFKAKDLNLVRANMFLTYAKTGEGTNPLGAFFDEL